ncbi:type II toxin-antitoxin system PemK/MazF family toxin [Nocardiopsis coralliicola]
MIVSDNSRNRSLGNFLEVRRTTLEEPRTGVVPLGPADRPLVGRVLRDEITLLYPDELAEDIGALSFATMTTVNAGLRAALAL